MAVPTQLSVVNGCLSTMGEAPLNELEPNHPYVQVALLALDRSLNTELGRGWWFNQDQVQLLPDAITGSVVVPADTLDLTTAWPQLVVRAGKLYDRIGNAYDLRGFMSAQGVTWIDSVVTRAVPFDDLPTLAKHLIALRTQIDFQASYDADSQRYSELSVQYRLINMTIASQNIRNSGVNVMRAPGVQDKLQRIAPRYRLGGITGGLKRYS